MKSQLTVIFRLALIAIVASGSSAYGATLWDPLEPVAARTVAQDGRQGGAAPTIIAYSESVPCPPTTAPRHVVSRPRRPRRRTHATGARRPHRSVRRVVHHPLHRVVHRRSRPVHPATHAHLTPAAAPSHTKRCVVLHHDRLTHASIDPATPAYGLVQTAYDPRLAVPTLSATALSSGRSAVADSPLGGGASGAPRAQAASSTGVVSAAPEPDAWVLMILGVGFAGAALRRRAGRELLAPTAS